MNASSLLKAVKATSVTGMVGVAACLVLLSLPASPEASLGIADGALRLFLGSLCLVLVSVTAILLVFANRIAKRDRRAIGPVPPSPSTHHPIDELLQSDGLRLAVAAEALAAAGQHEALPAIARAHQRPLLRERAEGRQVDVRAASALYMRQTRGRLAVDYAQPYRQLMLVLNRPGRETIPEVTTWCKEFIVAMPRLTFADTAGPDGALLAPREAKARAWNMLALIIYYNTYPDSAALNRPCPAASYCWEQALHCRPGDSDFERCRNQVSWRVGDPAA